MKAKINMLILLIVSVITQLSTAMDPFEQQQFNNFIKQIEWQRQEIHKQNLNYNLITAVRTSNIETVKKLLSEGAEVNTDSGALATCDKKGNIISGLTPLMWAAFNGNKAIVSLLLYKGAYSFITNNQGLTASDIADNNGYPELAQFIEAH